MRVFDSRADAARQLAAALGRYHGANPLVLAIPRGAVAMGRVLADALQGELDVVLVRKLPAPFNRELAIGAVDETGWVYLGEHAARVGGDADYVERVRRAELETLRRRRAQYTPYRPPIDPAGRIAIVVDDGLATGATMIAALHATRARGPAKLVCAVPVGAPDSLARVRPYCDELVCLEAPEDFYAVGQFYRDFEQVEDDEVIALLAATAQAPQRPGRGGSGATEVRVPAGRVTLAGDLECPPGARGVVVFSHGSGSGRRSPRNRLVARALRDAGFATLLLDLLTPQEDEDYARRFDIDLLTERLAAAVAYVREAPATSGLAVGLFGASTGAASALRVAAAAPASIAAVVSRGGRPDLAGEAALARVTAPTLLVVGGRDHGVIELNEAARDALVRCERELVLVPGATHLFEEHGTLEQVAALATQWFERHLGGDEA
jgi:predicted phosphoribosyltransferase/dienelactone hydrolase